jgi:plasmid stabilization system protein ParE
MADFVLTPAAEGDILGILDYIGRENPPAAVRVREALLDAMRQLAERPGIGHTRADLADEIVRFWPVFSYLVIYRPDVNPIQIVRVLHGKRDVRRLLEE